MNKLRNFVVLVTLTLGLSVLSPVSKTAQAATWHTGTPKALRGTWQKKVHEGGISFNTGIQIKASSFSTFSPGDPLFLKNLSYRKINHNVYSLKGLESIYTHKITHIKIKKTGSKIKYKITIPKQALHRKQIYSTWYPKH